METKQLRYFIICAQRESFSEAARELHTTQPNVSKVIRMLEDELGIELFVRDKQRILLNENGKEIYWYACEAMKSIQQVKEYAKYLREKLLNTEKTSPREA